MSARAQDGDRIEALDAGADDFLTKPFATSELISRLHLALRYGAVPRSGETRTVFEIRELRVDLLRRRATVRDSEIPLTGIEYRLLTTLIKKAGRLVTYSELIRETWSSAESVQQHHLRIHIAGLRRKLEKDSAHPVYLLSEIGIGYRLLDE